MVDLSLVIPVYRNASTLAELVRRTGAALAPTGLEYEILFVDDGSPDDAAAVLRELAAAEPRVAALILARNVGQNRALLTGFAWARGRLVAVMDADLQDPPEALPALLERAAGGCPVVFAGRRGQYESADRLLTSRLFKGLLHWICGIPADGGSYVLLSAEVVGGLLRLYAPQPYLVGMIGCLGYPMDSIPVVRAARPQGTSAYSSWMRLKTGLAGLGWALAWKYWHIPRRTPAAPNPATIQEMVGARFNESENRK